MNWDREELLDGPVPLWAQIAERLRQSVIDGEFVTGSNLPSETDLNKRFGVSRTTARSALNQLENEGFIVRRSGRGSTVVPRRVEQPLNLLSSFSDDMRDRGLEPGYGEVVVSVATVSSDAALAFGIDLDVEAVRVERVLLADGSPIGHSVSWLAPSIFPTDSAPSSDELGSSPLYTWIERNHGVRVAAGTEVIESSVADASIAAHLHVAPGAPVLVAKRTARAADGRVVEFVERRYRADRYRYRIELVRP